ncbi:MAG: alpha/beta fold hydrolase [Elusimicrobia bacterium]|nr:alpha/beta fold hydrolase [Candidatus Obscuribacterium magneticum]
MISPVMAEAWKPAKAEFKTKDGQVLKAYFQAPKGNKLTLVMLHGLTASKEEWLPLAEAAVKVGYGVFAYDARGHGESSLSKDAHGTPNGFQYFGPPGRGSPWERMIDDLGGAIWFLENQKKINRASVILAGASLGANVALNYASLTRSLKAVILLSPGLDYQKITTEGAIQQVGEIPVLIVASPGDKYAYASSVRLKSLSPRATFWSNVKPGHGVQMFDEDLLARIIQWLNQPK